MRLPAPLIGVLARVPDAVHGQPVEVYTRWFLTLLELDTTDRGTLSPDEQRDEIDHAEEAFASVPRAVAIRWVDIPLAERTLRLRVYTPGGPAVAGPRPGLLYLHGGGWVTGRPEGYDPLCSRLAEDAGCVVVSLEYRLAPEHPFPAAVDDVMDTWRWLRARAATLGIDPARIAVGGDSAGGNLSAVLCNVLPASEAPVLQVLIYPGTDMAGRAPSRDRYAEGYYLTDVLIRWFIDRYVPDVAQRSDPKVSPLRSPALGNVPALLVIAGLDPLSDEGRAYGARLTEAGVPVDTLEVPGMIHGFVSLDRILPVADAAVTELCRRVRAHLPRA